MFELTSNANWLCSCLKHCQSLNIFHLWNYRKNNEHNRKTFYINFEHTILAAVFIVAKRILRLCFSWWFVEKGQSWHCECKQFRIKLKLLYIRYEKDGFNQRKIKSEPRRKTSDRKAWWTNWKGKFLLRWKQFKRLNIHIFLHIPK